MKYLLGIAGMTIGQLIGFFVADNQLIGWSLGIILFVVGYHIPGFIKYARSTPKELLAFHGPDDRITRSTSASDLRAFLAELHKGGLLLDFHPLNMDVIVDRAQWNTLVDAEKTTLCRVLVQSKVVECGVAAGDIRIVDRERAQLATYSIADRAIHVS